MMTPTKAEREMAKPKAPAYAYSEQDTVRAQTVSDWLKRHDLQRSWLANKARINSSTLSQVLSGKYPANPTLFLDKMIAVLELESERMSDGTPGYVEGSVHKLCVVVCDRTRKDANFGVLVGHVGVGKTRALKEYQKKKPMTLLVEANPGMHPKSLLDDLLEQLNSAMPNSNVDVKFSAVVKLLKGTNYLVICDEAEFMRSSALHYLRRIRDKAQVGVVLSGTPKLHQLLKPERGQFDQIRSRVSMWPDTITTITRDDANDMATRALADFRNLDGSAVEPTDEVLDALWAYCAGSARVLMEGLIPAIRDYGQGRATVNEALVDQIARKVLFMKRATS